MLSVLCAELWNAGSIAFALNPLLTAGAIEALTAHGSPELPAALSAASRFGPLDRNDEPDRAAGRLGSCRAAHAGGTRAGWHYRITGQKIYITYGEHDCAENIIHLVLARLPDAPAGTRGISLFLCPKVLPDWGAQRSALPQPRAQARNPWPRPPAPWFFGDGGGATGWLIGEENKGLACMFTMMNNARLSVGVQGVALCEAAYQKALRYAKERLQGRAGAARR